LLFKMAGMRIAKQQNRIIMRTFIHGIANWRIVDQTHTGKIRFD
jgi:hypothetical protein